LVRRGFIRWHERVIEFFTGCCVHQRCRCIGRSVRVRTGWWMQLVAGRSKRQQRSRRRTPSRRSGRRGSLRSSLRCGACLARRLPRFARHCVSLASARSRRSLAETSPGRRRPPLARSVHQGVEQSAVASRRPGARRPWRTERARRAAGSRPTQALQRPSAARERSAQRGSRERGERDLRRRVKRVSWCPRPERAEGFRRCSSPLPGGSTKSSQSTRTATVRIVPRAGVWKLFYDRLWHGREAASSGGHAPASGARFGASTASENRDANGERSEP